MSKDTIHADAPPHCVSPRSQSGYTREYIYGPLAKRRGADEMPAPVRWLVFGVSAFTVGIFASHIGYFAFERAMSW